MRRVCRFVGGVFTGLCKALGALVLVVCAVVEAVSVIFLLGTMPRR